MSRNQKFWLKPRHSGKGSILLLDFIGILVCVHYLPYFICCHAANKILTLHSILWQVLAGFKGEIKEGFEGKLFGVIL